MNSYFDRCWCSVSARVGVADSLEDADRGLPRSGTGGYTLGELFALCRRCFGNTIC